MSEMTYKNRQTWPKGIKTSGLMMLYTDDELRNGWPIVKNVRVKNRDCMAKYGQEVASDYHLELVKDIYYAAGKPLVTDTQIRAFRKKLNTFKGKKINGWNGEWVIEDSQPPFWTREKEEARIDSFLGIQS
tara:strand:+ start:105 stop:497 length:393 start_codon:yes stop_codon:yes gene_type:complete